MPDVAAPGFVLPYVVAVKLLLPDFAAVELLLPDVADLRSAAPISDAKYKNSGFNGPR